MFSFVPSPFLTPPLAIVFNQTLQSLREISHILSGVTCLQLSLWFMVVELYFGTDVSANLSAEFE